VDHECKDSRVEAKDDETTPLLENEVMIGIMALCHDEVDEFIPSRHSLLLPHSHRTCGRLNEKCMQRSCLIDVTRLSSNFVEQPRCHFLRILFCIHVKPNPEARAVVAHHAKRCFPDINYAVRDSVMIFSISRLLFLALRERFCGEKVLDRGS
jgi:hypothetical protein